MSEHWSMKLRSVYQNSPTRNEDWWAYLLACQWQGVNEEKARETARLIMSLPTHLQSVWHGVSLMTGRDEECPCCPCQKARGLKSVQI